MHTTAHALLHFQDLQAAGIVRNRTTLGRWIRTRDFPKPLRIGLNTVAWRATEIDAWLAARAAERDAKAT